MIACQVSFIWGVDVDGGVSTALSARAELASVEMQQHLSELCAFLASAPAWRVRFGSVQCPATGSYGEWIGSVTAEPFLEIRLLTNVLTNGKAPRAAELIHG